MKMLEYISESTNTARFGDHSSKNFFTKFGLSIGKKSMSYISYI